MSIEQTINHEIAKRAIIASGGRITKELTLEDGTRRLCFEGVNGYRFRETLRAMIPDATIKGFDD